MSWLFLLCVLSLASTACEPAIPAGVEGHSPFWLRSGLAEAEAELGPTRSHSYGGVQVDEITIGTDDQVDDLAGDESPEGLHIEPIAIEVDRVRDHPQVHSTLEPLLASGCVYLPLLC